MKEESIHPPKSEKLKPKVGFAAIHNGTFELERGRKLRETVLEELRGKDLDLVEPVEDLVCNSDDARGAADGLRKGEVESIIGLYTSYINEQVPVVLAQKLPAIPQVAWVVPEEPELTPTAGFAAATSTLRRIDGYNYTFIRGRPEDSATIDRVVGLTRAGAATGRLGEVKIGVVGYQCPDQIDCTIDDVATRVRGPELLYLTVYEMAKIAEGISDEEIEGEVEEELDRFALEAPRGEFINSLKIYHALKKMIDQYDLDSVAVRCWPEDREKLAPCYAVSRLSDEEYVSMGESDVDGLMTQILLRWLSGEPTFNADLSTSYPDENVMQLMHCGCSPTRISREGSEMTINQQFAFEVGCTVEFPLKPGNVTLAKITRPQHGRSVMFVTTGEVLDREPVGRGNRADVKLDVSLDEFMDAYVENGVEHHIVLGYGDRKEEIEFIGQILGMEIVSL